MQKIIPAGIIALALVDALTGCASGGPVVEEKPVAEVEAPTEETETPEPEPAAAAGTRENPVPIETPAKHAEDSVWTYTFGATDTDAWPEIQAANQFNEAPAEGTVYVMVPVSLTVEDNEATAAGADPWASFDVAYVSAAGNTFASDTCLGVLPEPGELWNVGTMYGGASASFLACAGVPAADVAGGTWKVGSLIDPSASVFFIGG